MPPGPLNRRRFLGCSAAAGFALAHAPVVTAAPASPPRPVPVGLVGLGNRGTTLLRSLLAAEGGRVVAVCDADERNLRRGLGIAEKAGAHPPEIASSPLELLERGDVEAVVVAIPCDLHADVYTRAIEAGKHLYAEKPLGLTVEECDRVLAASAAAPDRVVHVGLQRRINPRYRAGLERIAEIGELLTARASWLSRHGPINGHDNWLHTRARSGDWMVEQAVHVWDLLHWVKGEPPVEAYGHGRRTAFRPNRDMTDFYSATLTWADGFSASLVHSWFMQTDDPERQGMELHLMGTNGFLDLTGGSQVVRDRTPQREIFPAGPVSDTDLAIRAFLASVRDPASTPTGLATLHDARVAAQVGFLVREAVDHRRVVRWQQLFG